MKMTTEATMISKYINLICSAQAKMKDADAIRAVRTLRHLELRQIEIRTGAEPASCSSIYGLCE